MVFVFVRTYKFNIKNFNIGINSCYSDKNTYTVTQIKIPFLIWFCQLEDGQE